MQQITLSGYLSADAQVRTSDSGTEFLSFTLCCRDSKGVSTFYPCTSFQTKGRLPSLLVKGTPLLVCGELQIYESVKDGQKYRNFRVGADRIHFAPQAKGSSPKDLPE